MQMMMIGPQDSTGKEQMPSLVKARYRFIINGTDQPKHLIGGDYEIIGLYPHSVSTT